jgi:two-component system LytT family response regulator
LPFPYLYQTKFNKTTLFKAAIVEDDLLSAEALKDILENDFPEIAIEAIYQSVADATEGIQQSKIDLVFLDMELEDGKGFDVLKDLSEISFEVIIITGHETYMLEAIKHAALDYLLKPVEKVELEEAFKRFKKKREKKLKNSRVSDAVRTKKLVIPNQDGLILVEIADIMRLESDGPYTTIHLDGGRKEVSSKNLGFYESVLTGHPFFRSHHSHIVNLDHVVTYVRGEGGHVVFSDQSIAPVSRRKKDDFLKALGA